jgi:ataxin-3
MLLQQIEAEGYSIFIVNGDIPSSEADEFAAIYPVPDKNFLVDNSKSSGRVELLDEESEMEKAIKMSLGQDVEETDMEKALKASIMDAGNDKESLAQAIAASLRDKGKGIGTEDSIEMAIQESLRDAPSQSIVLKDPTLDANDVNIKSTQRMSETSTGTPSTPSADIDEIRRKRLERFG